MKTEQFEKNKQFVYKNINRFLIGIYCQIHHKIPFPNHVELVSVIMLSFNRVDDTIFSIKQLYKHTKIPFELIVLDNNSEESQKKALKNFLSEIPNAKLIESDTNLGCARGRVVAAQYALGEYLLFIDNDIVVTPYYLENMLETLIGDPKTVAVSSMVVFPDCTIQFNGGTMVEESDADIYNLRDSGKLLWEDDVTRESIMCPWVPGGSTLWKTEFFEKFPIDEKMQGSFEDNEVSRRIGKAGYNVRNCPHSITIHYHMNFKDTQFSIREKQYINGRYDNDRTKNALKRYWQVHNKIFIFNCEEAVYGFLSDLSRKTIKKFLNNTNEEN